MATGTTRPRSVSPSVQHDLFVARPLPGLSLFEDSVLPAGERPLVAAIDGIELAPFRFQWWLGRRLTAAYGWRYDFDTGGFEPDLPLPD